MAQALIVQLAVPAAFSLASLLAGRGVRGHRLIVLCGALATFLSSLYLLAECMRYGALEVAALGARCEMGDAFALAVVNAIVLLASLYNGGLDPRGRLPLRAYGSLFMLLVLSSNYMVVARDPLALFLVVEALIGVSVALVGHSPRSDAPEVAFRFLVVTTLSAFLVLAGAYLVRSAEGAGQPADERLLALAGALLLAGLGADIGFFPFHSWVLDAFPASTPIVNVLMCAEHVPLFAALYRLLLPVSRAEPGGLMVLTMASLGLASIPLFYALAHWQGDPFRVLGCYSVAEYGSVLLAMAIGLLDPGRAPVWVAYALSSSLAKAGLLACLGVATSDLWGRAPRSVRSLVSLSFAVCALSSVGIPPFAGFHAKFGLIQAAYSLAAGRAGTAAGLALIAYLLALTFIPLYLLIEMLHKHFVRRLEEGGGRLSWSLVLAVAPCALSAGLLVLFGLWPAPLFQPLG